MDMWVPFMTAVATTLPNAAIVHDTFHIIRSRMKRVDEVRRRENKTLRATGIEDLVRSRYAWLRHPDNKVQQDKDTFYALQSKGLKVARAWAIKETPLELWSYYDDKLARAFFKARVLMGAIYSRLKPVIQVTKMLNRLPDNMMT